MSFDKEKTTEILENLQEKGDYFSRLCAVEKKRINDLEDAIHHINTEIEKFKNSSKATAIDVLNLHTLAPNATHKKTDGANISHEAHLNVKKVLSVHEAKLNRLLQKRSDVHNNLKKLKNEINHARKLRMQTDIQHNKYENMLMEAKLNIERLLSESTAIVEERDKLLEKKGNLERINSDEQNSFQEEFESLGNFIKAQNQALEDALLKERKQDNLERKGIKDDSFVTDMKQGELTLDEELAMARQVGTLTNFVLSEQNSLSGIQSKINSYESIFEQLKKMTGASSMEEVISSYVNQEEEMFSLYNFIQAVNSEIDTVLESTAQIEQSIESYKEQQEIQNEQRERVVSELALKHQTLLDSIKSIESETKSCQESVSQISKKVSSLFFKLQCDQMDNQKGNNTSNLTSSVGTASTVTTGNKISKSILSTRTLSNVSILTSQGVQESNVLEYMGCIEQRAVDIIAEYMHKSSNRHDIRSTAGPLSPVHWSTEPMVDLNYVNEDELVGLDSGSAMTNIISSDNSNDDFDTKPVDLSLYKQSLQKKLGLSNVTNPKEKSGSKQMKLPKKNSKK